MAFSTFAILISAAVICAAAALLAVFFVRRSLHRQGLVSRSLNLELLLVRFATVPPDPQLQLAGLREKISKMEQLYTALHGVRDGALRTFFYGPPFFALELAVPHIGEELSFYVAVPRRFAASFEKIIHGIYPEADIETSRDYNIFNPEGGTAGARLGMRQGPCYPLRTYQKLEGDPLGSLASVFTKLAKIGEGAAIQIVARPARGHWAETLKKHAIAVRQGKHVHDNVILKTLAAVDELVTPAKKQDAKPGEPKQISGHAEELARSLEAKAAKSLFEANIRIVASAPDEIRARGIMESIGAAFVQFTDPVSNGFELHEAKGWSLKNLLFNFAFRSFAERDLSVLSTEELTSLFHFPNVPIDVPHLKAVKAREAAPAVSLPTEGLILGYNEFRGDKSQIRLETNDRRRHLYIIGQTGTGKSAFLENMVVQDIEEGRGVCLIDPHGDMAERLLGFVPRFRMQDVIYFNPGDIERPMGLNMLEFDARYPHHKSLVTDELLGIFNKLFNMSVAGGPIFEQYFRNAAMLVMEDPASGSTLFEIERVLTDKAFRDLKLSRSKNVVVNTFWTQIAEKAGGEASLKDMVPYIASKFDGFLSHDVMRPIIMQQRSAFNFRDVMDEGKILLVNLSKGHLGELNSSLLGLIIVGKLLIAALSRADMDEAKRRDFYFYIDEFQNVTTDSIASILSEARKYRLNLTIAHQFIGQLKEEIKKAVFGNVGSMAAFRIGSDDAEFMETQFKPVFSAYDLLNVDNYNCYVKLLIRGEPQRPFSMKTYPPRRGDSEIAAAVKELSRTKYGRPRDEVEREIFGRSTAGERHPA